MKGFAALATIIAFLLSVISVHSADAGWKENYREKYSKQQVKSGSPQEKKIRTLANMDFEYKDWSKPMKKRERTKDKFQGFSANFTPANAGGVKREAKTGYTLTGVIRELGNNIVNPAGAAPAKKSGVTPAKKSDVTPVKKNGAVPANKSESEPVK